LLGDDFPPLASPTHTSLTTTPAQDQAPQKSLGKISDKVTPSLRFPSAPGPTYASLPPKDPKSAQAPDSSTTTLVTLNNPYRKQTPSPGSRVSFTADVVVGSAKPLQTALKTSKYQPTTASVAPNPNQAVFQDALQPSLYRIDRFAPTTDLGIRLIDKASSKSTNAFYKNQPGLTKQEFAEETPTPRWTTILQALASGDFCKDNQISKVEEADPSMWQELFHRIVQEQFHSGLAEWKHKGDYTVAKKFMFVLRNSEPQNAPNWQINPEGINNPSTLEKAYLGLLLLAGNRVPLKKKQPPPQASPKTPMKGFKLKGQKATSAPRANFSSPAASTEDWSLIHNQKDSTKFKTIFKITGNGHKPFDNSNCADKNAIAKWIFQNVYTKLESIDPSFIWTYYPGFDNATLPPNTWKPITANTPMSAVPNNGWVLTKFIPLESQSPASSTSVTPCLPLNFLRNSTTRTISGKPLKRRNSA